ncbi:NACHT domain-containing protein [Streptosporangium sp. NPDC000239]|uniref:NACHT domain-containing protein n=1 Tax=Streptosporangium sp. NPDC000239 TaxID=3154248 RepID=UPI0033180494
MLIFFVRQDQAAGWGAVLGVLTAAAGLLLSQLERFFGPRAGGSSPKSEADALLKVADQLAVAVREQWEAEAALRRLNDPWPLNVSWTKEEELTDPIYALPAARAGDARAARAARADVPLDGDLAQVADFFESLPGGRLVILGPLGSGKSVLALTLLLELLERRVPGRPVPVLIPLNRWNPAEIPLEEWLADQLATNYQLGSPRHRDARELARRLLHDNLVLPILDGLDELAEPTRPQAITDVNGWLGRDRQIVLTSRTNEYRAAVLAGDAVTRGAAVVLQPLGCARVEEYLRGATARPRVRRWDPVFAEMRDNPDGPVATALRTPLMVTLARAIYGDRPGDAAVLLQPRLATAGLVEEHLLGELVRAAYPDERRGPQAGDVQVWLTFLARNLSGRDRPDIAWWHLETAAPAAVVHAPAAVVGACVVGFVFGPVAAVVFAVAVLLLAGDRRTERWSLEGILKGPMNAWLRGLRESGARGGLLTPLIGLNEKTPLERRLALGAGRVLGMVTGLVQGFVVYQTGGLYRAVAEGVGLGLAVGLADGYLTISTRSEPSEVRFASRRGAVAFVRHVAIGCVTGVGVGVTAWAISASWFGVLVGILVGLAFGVIDGLNIWLDVSTDVTLALSPRSTRRAERLAALARSLTLFTTIGVTTGIAYTFAYGVRAAVLPATVFGLGYALADHLMGLTTSVWGRYAVAKAWLALLGRVPWRFMDFLDDTHRRGLLRRVGAVYQFRHVRFQEYLLTWHN